MLFSFLSAIGRFIFWIVNGRLNVKNANRIPKGNYILVGPHRTWFDPLLFALAGNPKHFTFLAKKELFENPIMKWILVHVNAIEVDRENPGPSVIKKPVRILQKTDLSIIMFPSGTRHSQELKGGVVLIAKLAKVPIVPTVYQGPLTFKKLFSRKAMTIDFGDPIYVDKKHRVNEKEETTVESQMDQAFKKLDNEIDPNFHYVDVSAKKS